MLETVKVSPSALSKRKRTFVAFFPLVINLLVVKTLDTVVFVPLDEPLFNFKQVPKYS